MATRVFKYQLAFEQYSLVPLPANAVVLCVGGQGDGVRLWAQISTEDVEIKRRKFFVFATGATIPEGFVYIGTAFLYGAQLVFHVYEDAGYSQAMNQ